MTDTIEDVPTDTSTLDAIVTIASTREYFDEKEIKSFITQLNDKGIDEHQITGKLLDWVRDRKYASGTLVMNTMLDVRNIIAPYPAFVAPSEPVEPVENEIHDD